MSSIASRQSKGTENLKKEVKQFLEYCATHPNAGVRFVASDMMLALHSDASYLSDPYSKAELLEIFSWENKTRKASTMEQS